MNYEIPEPSEQGVDKWKDMRIYIPAVAVSSILHTTFFLRNYNPFKKLMLFSENPSYLEWIGYFVVVYAIPGVIFFILAKKKQFLDISDFSDDFGVALAVFAGISLSITCSRDQ